MSKSQPSLRPAPIATGSLGKRPLAHLLVYVLDRKMTGSFELVDDTDEIVHIVARDGMVSRVSTSEPVTYLGHVLYEIGAINDAQLSQSLAEVAATKRLHGQVLLEKGMLDLKQLADGLRRQRSRKLHHAFELSPLTTYAFYPGIDLVGERPNDVAPMDPLASIWRGTLEHPPWDHVRSTITAVGERPLRVVGAIERVGFEGKEREMAEGLRNREGTILEQRCLPGHDPKAA
jgi:hypothetical protein